MEEGDIPAPTPDHTGLSSQQDAGQPHQPPWTRHNRGSPPPFSRNSTLTSSGYSPLLLAQLWGWHRRPDLVIELTHSGPCENPS